MEQKFKNEIGFILDTVKKLTFYIIVPEEDEKEKMDTTIFEEIMAENFGATKYITLYIDSRIPLTP